MSGRAQWWKLVPARRLASVARGGVLLLGALALAAPPARAQQTAGDGFLFREPVVGLTLRGGYDRASAGSDVFSFTTDQLTLDRGNFSAPTLALDVAVRLTPRVDLVLGAAYAKANPRSEFRDYVDLDDLPIEQTTNFVRVPVTAGVKAYITPRGRSVGSFAWIPARVAPYVGAGGGAMWYRFRQAGDFVDFETLDIFGDTFESDGWTPTAYGTLGLDYTLTPHFALTAEGRYTWARGPLRADFADFERIDLSGLAVTAGVTFRF